MQPKELKYGYSVSIWGRYDENENPQVLSVKKNGIWVMRSERNLLGKIVVTKQRYPKHAVAAIG